jgi:hypothetical protein
LAKSGAIRSALTAASMLSQISTDVPLPTATPENASAAKPGTVSAIGAKSGACGQRVGVDTKSPNAAGEGLWSDRRGVVDSLRRCGASQQIVESWCTAAIVYGGEVDSGHALEHFARKVRRRSDSR